MEPVDCDTPRYVSGREVLRQFDGSINVRFAAQIDIFAAITKAQLEHEACACSLGHSCIIKRALLPPATAVVCTGLLHHPYASMERVQCVNLILMLFEKTDGRKEM